MAGAAAVRGDEVLRARGDAAKDARREERAMDAVCRSEGMPVHTEPALEVGPSGKAARRAACIGIEPRTKTDASASR